MEGVLCFKSWFLDALGLIHGGAYYRNFTVFVVLMITSIYEFFHQQKLFFKCPLWPAKNNWFWSVLMERSKAHTYISSCHNSPDSRALADWSGRTKQL